jgi:hypothetical protein
VQTAAQLALSTGGSGGGGGGGGGVVHLVFSRDGQHLLAVSAEPEYTATLFTHRGGGDGGGGGVVNPQEGEWVEAMTTKLGPEFVGVGASFYPGDTMAPGRPVGFACVGPCGARVFAVGDEKGGGLGPVHVNVIAPGGGGGATKLDVHGASTPSDEVPPFESLTKASYVTSHCWGAGGSLWLGDASGVVHARLDAAGLPAKAAAEATGVTRADGIHAHSNAGDGSEEGVGGADDKGAAVLPAFAIELDLTSGVGGGGGGITGLASTAKGLILATGGGRVAWLNYIADGDGGDEVWGNVVESVNFAEQGAAAGAGNGAGAGGGCVSALSLSPSFTSLVVGTTSGALAQCPAWMPLALEELADAHDLKATVTATAAAAGVDGTESTTAAAVAAAGAAAAEPSLDAAGITGETTAVTTADALDENGAAAVGVRRAGPEDLVRWVTRGHGGAVNAVVPLRSSSSATTGGERSVGGEGEGAPFATACADGVLRVWSTAGGAVALVGAFDAGGDTALTAAAALPPPLGYDVERGHSVVVGTASGAVNLVTGLATGGGVGGPGGSGGSLGFSARLHDGAVAAVAVASTAGRRYVATLGADDGRVVFLSAEGDSAYDAAAADTLVSLGYVRCKTFGKPRAIAWMSSGDGGELALAVSIENGDVVRLTPPPAPPAVVDVAAPLAGELSAEVTKPRLGRLQAAADAMSWDVVSGGGSGSDGRSLLALMADRSVRRYSQSELLGDYEGEGAFFTDPASLPRTAGSTAGAVDETPTPGKSPGTQLCVSGDGELAAVGTSGGGVGTFHIILQSKTHPVDDSRYCPCNQSDTRECNPKRRGRRSDARRGVGQRLSAGTGSAGGGWRCATARRDGGGVCRGGRARRGRRRRCPAHRRCRRRRSRRGTPRRAAAVVTASSTYRPALDDEGGDARGRAAPSGARDAALGDCSLRRRSRRRRRRRRYHHRRRHHRRDYRRRHHLHHCRRHRCYYLHLRRRRRRRRRRQFRVYYHLCGRRRLYYE